MIKFREYSKNPKHKKIGTAKLYSRIKILVAGGLMTFAVIFTPSFKELGMILAVSSAIVFVWDIVKQTQSAVETENRISDLEKRMKNLEEDNSKKDQQ